MNEIEQLLALPNPIPLDDVPNGLLNRVDDLLTAKNAKLDRLKKLGTVVALAALRQKQAEGLHPTTGHPIIELLRLCDAIRSVGEVKSG